MGIKYIYLDCTACTRLTDMKAPLMAPIKGAMVTRPTPETLKLYSGTVKRCARTLPTTTDQEVFRP